MLRDHGTLLSAPGLPADPAPSPDGSLPARSWLPCREILPASHAQSFTVAKAGEALPAASSLRDGVPCRAYEAGQTKM